MPKSRFMRWMNGLFRRKNAVFVSNTFDEMKCIKPVLTDEEVDERQPLWEVLSEMWRDTELREYDLKYIAKVLAQSRFSWEEIEEIFLFEVAPVVHHNLRITAGVSENFDPVWLKGKILKNMKTPYGRAEVNKNQKYITELVMDDWNKIRQYVQFRRQDLTQK